jgi:flagellar motor protein MotB
MRNRSRIIENNLELEVWPAFTDLMSNSFMILSLLLLLAVIKSLFIESISDANQNRAIKLEQEVSSLQNQLQQKTNELIGLQGQVGNFKNQVTQLQGLVNTSKGELQKKSNRVTELEAEIKKLNSPPVIIIRDSKSRRFESGSAEISGNLKGFIESDLVKQIENFAKEYQGYIVEVIGHTDGQVNKGSTSNLDTQLEQVVKGNKSVSSLTAGSNADLGLMRALAVVQKMQQNSRLQELGLQFRAYSAAQLYNPIGDYAEANRNPDQSRRRIEVRFTPSAVER